MHATKTLFFVLISCSEIDDPDQVVDGLDETIAQLHIVRRKNHRNSAFVVEESHLGLAECCFKTLCGTHGHTKQCLDVLTADKRLGRDRSGREMGKHNVAASCHRHFIEINTVKGCVSWNKDRDLAAFIS